jgi:hypothetical protein
LAGLDLFRKLGRADPDLAADRISDAVHAIVAAIAHD